MLDAESGPVGIVIKKCEVLAPTHPHCVARCEQDIDDGTETLRPRLNWAERRFRPVVFSDKCGERTVLAVRQRTVRIVPRCSGSLNGHCCIVACPGPGGLERKAGTPAEIVPSSPMNSKTGRPQFVKIARDL